MQPNPDQKKAIAILDDWLSKPYARTAKLTGAGGTGKSFTIANVLKRYQDEFSIFLTGPTNEARFVLEEFRIQSGLKATTNTVFSSLGLRIKSSIKGKELYKSGRATPIDKASNFPLLVVDESSMINSEVHSYIMECGASKVLFIGDECQLPPVGEDFSVALVQATDYEYGLTQVVRYSGAILENCNLVRHQILNEPTKAFRPDRFVLDSNCFDELEMFELTDCVYDWVKRGEDFTIISFTHDRVDKWNSLCRRYLYGEKPELPFMPGDLVRVKDQPLMYKERDPETGVAQYRGYSLGCVNSRHRILSVDIQKVGKFKWYVMELQPTRSNHPDDIIPAWTIHEEDKEAFSNYLGQLRIKGMEGDKDAIQIFESLSNCNATFQHCFSATVHSLQGRTVENVIVDLDSFRKAPDKALLNRLLYTGISRAKQRVFFNGSYCDYLGNPV